MELTETEAKAYRQGTIDCDANWRDRTAGKRKELTDAYKTIGRLRERNGQLAAGLVFFGLLAVVSLVLWIFATCH